jgi:hypothetical protein
LSVDIVAHVARDMQIPQLRRDIVTPDYCSLLCDDEVRLAVHVT